MINIAHEVSIADVQNRLERMGKPVPYRDDHMVPQDYLREAEMTLTRALDALPPTIVAYFPSGTWELVKKIYVKGSVRETEIPLTILAKLGAFSLLEEDLQPQTGGRFLKLTAQSSDS